jgi:hypothetical protein
MGLIPAGIYAGYRLTQDRDYSSGRGYFIETTGILGGLTGFLVPALTDMKFDSVSGRRVIISSVMAGHALGTWFGFKYHEETSYTFFQGVFTSVSGVCGSALGLSFPFLDKVSSGKPYIVWGLLGAWGGILAGEHLGKSLFEVTGHDQKQLSHINFSVPLTFQWPMLLNKSQERDPEGRLLSSRVDVVRLMATF